jgi:hypothetical protein
MLIAIFALLLISVVAIAMVISSGTDSSLAGNYRTSTTAYYGAVAGLEEARGRLLWKNLDFINKTGSYPNLFDPSRVMPAWCVNQVLYITNPAYGETVDPTSANPANYPDTEFVQEFPGGLGSVTVIQIPSVSAGVSLPGGGTLPGPSYKWVRINAVTQQSLNIVVDATQSTAPGVLYYDPAHVNSSNQPAASLVVPPVLSCPPTPPPITLPATASTAVQALEITALAVAPNGGTRLLQYIVAPLIISPDTMDQNFPAALTLDGNGVVFQAPGAPNYYINGQDGCAPPPAAVYSIAYSNPLDFSPIQTQVNPDKNYYPGLPMTPPLPSRGPFTPTYPGLLPSPFQPPVPPPGFTSGLLRTSWQRPATLDAVMQDIENSADVVLAGPATSTEISNAAPLMSPSNPMTIVVNGNLRLNGRTFNGYGLLLVTGTLTYDPDASWNGIVLVVGQGILTSNGSGSGGFTGTVFLAQTRDSAGNLLPGNSLGGACFGTASSCGVGFGHHGFGGGYGSNPGFGISYNSCWMNSAKGPLTYKVLSFHEVPLPN